MRRTLALVGATALAVAGLAGPAAADDIGTQQMDVQAVEVAIGLQNAGPDNDINHDYLVLQNFASEQNLNGTEVRSCNALGSSGIFSFGPDDIVPAGGSLLLADHDYTGPTPYKRASFDSLSQTANVGVYFWDTNPATPELVNGVFWGGGMPPAGCPSGLESADNDPTSIESLHDNGATWGLDDPNPRNTTS